MGRKCPQIPFWDLLQFSSQGYYCPCLLLQTDDVPVESVEPANTGSLSLGEFPSYRGWKAAP